MNKDSLMYIILFLISFSFVFFFIYGLPVHLYRDVSTLLYTKINTPYTVLIDNIFFGRSSSFISWDNDIIARPTLVFISKLLYTPKDQDGILLYLSRIFTVSLIPLFLCYFLYLGTGNRILSFLGGFFYITLPPVFSATWLYTDAQVLADLFVLIALIMFYQLIYTEKNKILFLSGFILSLVISIKTKESAKLILPVFMILVLFYYRKILIYFIPAFLYITFLISPFAGSGPSFSDFSFTGIYHKVIASGGGDYAGEVPTLLSLTQHFKQVPVAMLSQLGFFLGWFFVLSLLFYCYRKPLSLKFMLNKIRASELGKEDFLYIFTTIWLVVTITSYGFFTTYVEHRYNAAGMIPFTLFLFLTSNKIALLITPINIKKLFLRMFILLTLFTIVVNSYHIAIDIRGGVIGYWKGYYDVQKYLFSKHANNKYPEESLQAFLWGSNASGAYPEITYVLNYTYTVKDWGWMRHISYFNETIINDNMIIYFVTINSNASPILLNETLYTIKHEEDFGGCFDNSPYCLLKNLIKRPERTHFLYSLTKRSNS